MDTCDFECLKLPWSCPSNMIVSTCRKLWCLSAPKVNLIPCFFPEMLQRFCKVLFWILWHDWTYKPKLIASTCRKVWSRSACQKSNFIPTVFLEILERLQNCTLSMPEYGYQKRRYQLVENFDVYLHAKNQIYHYPLSWDTAKILQTWYFQYFKHA